MAEDDYAALRNGAAALELPRDVVRASGPDLESYLQGQLSQDVGGLAVGAGRHSLLLDPRGRLEVVLRLTRVGVDELVLDTSAGSGKAMVARLERFKLRTRFELEPLPGWRCLGVRGPTAHERIDGAAIGDAMAVDADWPSLAGVDLLGERPTLPPGVASCGWDAWEAVRLEAGIPASGHELTPGLIPAEAGQELIDRTVSFTKGCYTGQELVARIDSRGGNVARRMEGLLIGGGEVPPAGALVHVGDKEVGAVTSSAWSPGRDAAIALAYVARAVQVGDDVTVDWEGGEAPATVERLPLLGTAA